MAESAAMKSINSRKGQTSITHLMNFSLPPRPYFQQQQHHLSNHRHQRRNPTWGLGSGYHAIDKARYVHANYRFIVRPDREFRTQAADADVHLEWDAVLQILASAETQLTSCPICLSTPVAPRMAKCGHIFCLPCLIRYMHSMDDSSSMPEKRARWKKCPICEDSIYISETRPVRWFIGQEASMLQEGGDVLLKLLMREPGSTLALPRDVAERYDSHDDIPWYHAAEVMDYAHFMKGSEDYMTFQYDEEVGELEAQEKEDELMFGDDTTWTKKAVTAINEAKLRLRGIGNPPNAPPQPFERKPPRDPIIFDPPEDVPEMYIQKNASRSVQKDSSSASPLMSTSPIFVANIGREPIITEPEKLAESTAKLVLVDREDHGPFERQMNSQVSDSSLHRPHVGSYFFYNALPKYFLSPLDIRILKAAFGNFVSFPSTILPRVERISTGHIVDEDLRKRAKYLGYLPYGCEVNFLECDWTDVISPTVLAHFTTDITRRRKRNHEKEAREERERLRAEKEEDDKRWAAARRKMPSVIEKSFSESDFQPLAQNEGPLATSPSDSQMISMTPPWSTARTHSSFATLATPGTSPDAPRTVWGTTIIPPSSPPIFAAAPENTLPDDGWLQGWEHDLLDNDDALAMVEASNSGEGSSKAVITSSGRHKKKNKKITLMSTNVRRGA